MKELKDPSTGQVSEEAAREWYKIYQKEQGGAIAGDLLALSIELLLPWWATPSELGAADLDSLLAKLDQYRDEFERSRELNSLRRRFPLISCQK